MSVNVWRSRQVLIELLDKKKEENKWTKSEKKFVFGLTIGVNFLMPEFCTFSRLEEGMSKAG